MRLVGGVFFGGRFWGNGEAVRGTLGVTQGNGVYPERGIGGVADCSQKARLWIMVNRSSITVMLLMGLLLIGACAPPVPPFSPPGATLTSADAVLIAEKAATDEGIELDNYNAPSIVYVASGGKSRWWVHFDGKRAMPGNHFSVSIVDDAGTAHLYRGR